MTHPVPHRSLACLLVAGAATLATLGATPPGSAAESVATRTPLRVSVETLTPAVMPRTGRVTLTGVITNRSAETWTNLRVYMLASHAPIQIRSELARQSATSAAAEVGHRVTGDGLYDQVGDLAPGQSESYRLSVRRQDLAISGAPGVYWVGVHVLGTGDGVRDTVADGRARTFMPLLPQGAALTGTRTRLALIVPVVQPVHRGADTRLVGFRDWQRSVQTDGRLDRLLGLSGRAAQALTWVVDPAVLDAVRSVAQDNPPLNTGPTTSSSGDGASPSSSASPSPGASPTSPGGDTSGTGGRSPSDLSTAAASARAWLAGFRRQAGTHTVAALPYGDLDVASVLDSPFRALYAQAVGRSRRTMARFGVDGVASVAAPASGYLPSSALRGVVPESTVVLGAQAVPGAEGPVLARDGRAPVVLTDSAAGSGGPRPGSRYAALAVRQRLLSDAALHALSADRDQPLVVSMPDDWDPGAAWRQANFFAGLDQPWLQMVDLPTVADGVGAAASPTPVYPRAERAKELPRENLLATQALVRAGRAYGGLLSSNQSVDDDLARVALLGSSEHDRADPARARVQLVRTTNHVRAQMGRVHLEGPPFVMMSGESGPIQITVVNELDQPVRVGIRSETPSSDLTISDVDPVTLGPGRRTAIRLNARSHDIGVHPVTLVATTGDGIPLGSRTQFTVRTSHVSTVIWVIMGVGGGLLFLAIVVRLVRRIRRRKATHGPLLARERAAAPGKPSGQELNA